MTSLWEWEYCTSNDVMKLSMWSTTYSVGPIHVLKPRLYSTSICLRYSTLNDLIQNYVTFQHNIVLPWCQRNVTQYSIHVQIGDDNYRLYRERRIPTFWHSRRSCSACTIRNKNDKRRSVNYIYSIWHETRLTRRWWYYSYDSIQHTINWRCWEWNIR